MEPLKFDPTKEGIGESFEISEERSQEMCDQYALAWHEITTPTKEFQEKGLNSAEGLRKFGAIANTPEELLMAGYTFGRKLAQYEREHSNPLARFLSTLKGE